MPLSSYTLNKDKTFWWTIALGAVLILSGATAEAGKLYKIIDENGNVTFSQFPPTNQQRKESGVKVEEKRVDAGGKTAVSEKNGYAYCGSIQLPSQERQRNYFYSNLTRRLESWREQLKYYEERLERSQKNYLTQSRYYSGYGNSASRAKRYLDRDQEVAQKARDYRCAVAWAETQLDSSREKRYQAGQELERLTKVRTQLEWQQERVCGKEPVYDPSRPGNHQARKDWNRCSAQFQKDLNTLDSKIREEKRRAGL